MMTSATRYQIHRIFVAIAVIWTSWRVRLSRGEIPGTVLIVFSKDRAAQLDLLLSTMSTEITDPVEVFVLYSASDASRRIQYEGVLSRFRAHGVIGFEEHDFRTDVIEILAKRRERNVMFLVDDMAFVGAVPKGLLSHWDARARGVLSLRLGLNITHSFNRGNVVQPQPTTTAVSGPESIPLVSWRWTRGTGDWSLPTSVDGHLLARSHVVEVARRTSFRAPNSFERALGEYRFLFKHRRGYALRQAVVVNFPLNSVKSEDFQFPHLGLDLGDLDLLTNSGRRLSLEGFPIERHRSVHMPWIPPQVEGPDRGKRPQLGP